MSRQARRARQRARLKRAARSRQSRLGLAIIGIGMLLVVVGLVSFVLRPGGPLIEGERATLLAEGERPRLPQFTAPTLAGGVFDSGDIKSRTVIQVFAEWCDECEREAPAVAAVDRVRPGGVNLVLLAVASDPSKVRSFMERHGWPDDITVVLDPDREVEQILGLSGQPHMIVVDDERRIAAIRSGASSVQSTEALIASAL